MYYFIILFSVAVIFFSGCAENTRVHEDFEEIYKDAGFTGSFILYDYKKEIFHIYNEARVTKRFVPASTFKVMSSLIALETGVVDSIDQVIKWDGVKRDIPEWNQDLTMREAFYYSAVPVYQKFAREIGFKGMMEYLVRADYGNKSFGSKVDRFWLDGPLEISQKEQVNFLRRLYENELPFSDETMAKVKEIMLRDIGDGFRIYSKTGLANPGDKKYIGWYVGWVETNDNVYFFANNIESDKFELSFIGSRILIARNIFERLNIIPPAEN